MLYTPPRFSPQSGIAIGPILFVLGILAILGAVLSSGFGSMGSAGITDRITADIQAQANLIRAKISECNVLYGTNNNYDGYPSSNTTNGTLVSALTCAGDPMTASGRTIWNGSNPSNQPPPTRGFDEWHYINTNGSGLGGTATGGRCIWIEPTTPSSAIAEGLTRASKKFTHATANDGASEVNFDPASTHQRFVVWISAPPAAGSETANCTPQ